MAKFKEVEELQRLKYDMKGAKLSNFVSYVKVISKEESTLRDGLERKFSK